MYTPKQVLKGVRNPALALREGRNMAENQVLSRLRLLRGVATLPFKEKPDILGIGPPKCGTTSLRAYLESHSAIYNVNWGQVIDSQHTKWRQHAGLRSNFHKQLHKNDKGEYKTIMKRAGYFHDFRLPELVHDQLPHVKILVIFRDPVKRAISQYYYNRRNPEVELLSFEEAIEREESRLKREREHIERDPTYAPDNYLTYSYKNAGKYHKHLDDWLDYFPRDQILCLKFEDFFADPEESIQEVFDFVRVSRESITAEKAYKSNEYDPDISEAVIADLEAEFKPHNERLSELLDRDFSWGY
jgi:hypothetical protein